LARELAAAPEQKRKELLRNHVRAIAAKLLAVRPEELREDQPLNDVGLDSLMAIELRGALSASVGRTLPSTLLFDHPTIGAVVAYLVQNMSGETGTVAATPANDNFSDEAVDRLVLMSDDEAEALLLRQLEAMDHS
jgi:acyl carrier protein